jgi:hypothetical protein
VKLSEYTCGSAIRIIYLDCGQKCDLDKFLSEIERARPQEYNQLTALLDKTAKYGPVFNNYRTKRLQGSHAQPLYEFCGRKEARIFWFFDERDNGLIVCTHGFIGRGRHDHRSEIDRAQIKRGLYYEHKRTIGRGTGGEKLGA